MWETLRIWDRELFLYLNQLGIERLDSFWVTVTQTLFWIPLFVLFFYLIYRKFGKKKGLLVAAFAILALLLNNALMLFVKYVVARLRPNNVPELEGLIRALQAPTSFSFYSGHASNSFVLTVFVVLVLRKSYPWAYVFFVFPLLFSLSRIFVGVHYPSDLLVGAMMGTGIAFWVYSKMKVRLWQAS